MTIIFQCFFNSSVLLIHFVHTHIIDLSTRPIRVRHYPAPRAPKDLQWHGMIYWTQSCTSIFSQFQLPCLLTNIWYVQGEIKSAV
jgi:hypothetical protein